MTGTDVSITKIDYESDLTESGFTRTKGVLLGVPYNDATFKVVANQVFIGIPLGLLGYGDGNMDVVIDSFTLQGSLSGDIDSVPDFGDGALDTSNGSIKPLLNCVLPKVHIADPAGDSLGFGLDGDDITAVDVCYAGNTLLVTVTYSSLSPDDNVVTTVMFDTDQDPDNIPECALVYCIYSGKLGANTFGDFGGTFTVRDATHLITMLGNKMYLSVPLEFLGDDDGAMNINTETALVVTKAGIPLTEIGRGWVSSIGEIKLGRGEVHIDPDKFSRTIYDRAPDTGFIPICRYQIKGDLNGDNRLTPADAVIALRLASRGAHDPAADVSGDGSVTSLDALMILRAAADSTTRRVNRSAVIETSIGTMTAELYGQRVPNTTANFIELAERGFYDGLIFHRVIDDFVIQGGCPNGDGTGSSGKTIELEIHPDLVHVDGVLAMARSQDPDSASSQFYICDGAQHFLDGQYAVFGRVIDGMDVMRAIAEVATGSRDKPIEDVMIIKISIIDRE